MAQETPKGDRIAKVLARAGVASRREAERMIEAGCDGLQAKPYNFDSLLDTIEEYLA